MILGSLETGVYLNSSDRALERGEAEGLLGLGTGTTRQIIRAIETAMNTTGNYVNKLSGLKGWSDNIRCTAGLVQLVNVRKWAAEYDKLDKSKAVQLGALGIGEPEAKRLHELFAKYGADERRGLFSPGISKWLNERDGDHMKYVPESALIKAQKRAPYTSGYGISCSSWTSGPGRCFSSSRQWRCSSRTTSSGPVCSTASSPGTTCGLRWPRNADGWRFAAPAGLSPLTPRPRHLPPFRCRMGVSSLPIVRQRF